MFNMVACTKQNWEVCVDIKRKTNWFSLLWEKNLKRQHTAWEKKLFFSPDNNVSVIFLIIKLGLLTKLR